MVATIVLIGLVMVIAGVLAAGLSGSAPQAPKNARIGVSGFSPDTDVTTDNITITHNGGDPLLSAFGSNNNQKFTPDQVDIRINGISLETADVKTLTSGGENKEYANENIDFKVGDTLKISNIQTAGIGSVSSGDSLRVIWTPNDQILLSTEA